MFNFIKVTFNSRTLIFASVFIALGLFYMGSHVFRSKINSVNELAEINGTLDTFSFIHEAGRIDHDWYFIYLENYTCHFQIDEDFLNIFNKVAFEKEMRWGDSIRILIPKKSMEFLKSEQDFKLFGIYGAKSSYMETNDAIDEYNDSAYLTIGILFCVIGGSIFFFNRKKFSA